MIGFGSGELNNAGHIESDLDTDCSREIETLFGRATSAKLKIEDGSMKNCESVVDKVGISGTTHLMCGMSPDSILSRRHFTSCISLGRGPRVPFEVG